MDTFDTTKTRKTIKMTKKRSPSSIRWIIQLALVVIIIGGASLRNLMPGGSFLATLFPELQGFCPFGAVRSVTTVFTDFSSLANASHSNLWVLLGVAFITLLFGAVFCSTLCPLGTIQEWVGKLGRRIFRKRYNPPVPEKLDRILSSIRYVILLGIPLAVIGLIAFDIDLINPSYALTHLWTTAVPVSALLVLALILLLSLRYERPWCRWFCPYGVIIGTISRFSFWKIRRNEVLCIHCGRCDRDCHAHLIVSKIPVVTDNRCITCQKCVATCPVPGALTYSTKGKSPMSRFWLLVLPLIVLVVFLLPLGFARVAGLYQPAGVSSNIVVASGKPFTAQDISPMLSLEALAGKMGTATTELLLLLGLPEDYDSATLLIDIEEDPDFGHITLGFIREIVVAQTRL
jgi:polyferredoxin